MNRPALALAILGCILLGAGVVPLVRGEAMERQALAEFASAVQMREQHVAGRHGRRVPRTPAHDGPAAVLHIARIDLEVPVHAGTDEEVLARGAGLIEGTASPGSEGNIGIAAHRDRQFRRLGELEVGDLIRLASAGNDRDYRVTRLSIVSPSAVDVLDPTASPSLTLVTCYPFRFVGAAPQRYIVRAEADPLPNVHLE